MRKMYDNSEAVTIEKLISIGVPEKDIPELLKRGIRYQVQLPKPKGEKSNHLIFNGGDRLKALIQDRLEMYGNRMFWAKVKGKARRHGKDKETRGARIKGLKADLRKDLRRFGCSPIYIKRQIEKVDKDIKRQIELYIEFGTLHKRKNGDILILDDPELQAKKRELVKIKELRKQS